MQNKQGFTLVELLVVVLIIGVLTAVALPMYQGAVDKSHFSTLLPVARALKNAEEAFMMANGVYTSDPTELDVSVNTDNLTIDLQVPNSTSEPNVIKVTNNKLGNNVRLASYLKDNVNFADQVYCQAKTGDERAEKLCGKILGGEELLTDGEYTSYLIEGQIDSGTCGAAGRAWSQTKDTCYKTEEDRCGALGMNYYGNSGFPYLGGLGNRPGLTCGYAGWDAYNKPGLELDEGGMCYVTSGIGGCDNAVFQNGGICLHRESSGCQGGTYTNGSACVTNTSYSWVACNEGSYDNSICFTTSYGCSGNNFTNNSVCYGGYCANGTYDETSCCCGSSCGSKPKCDASRCNEIREQYQPYLN